MLYVSPPCPNGFFAALTQESYEFGRLSSAFDYTFSNFQLLSGEQNEIKVGGDNQSIDQINQCFYFRNKQLTER